MLFGPVEFYKYIVEQKKPLSEDELYNQLVRASALPELRQYNKNPKIIRLLLEHGADAEAKDVNGKTPEEYAVYNRNREEIPTEFASWKSK